MKKFAVLLIVLAAAALALNKSSVSGGALWDSISGAKQYRVESAKLAADLAGIQEVRQATEAQRDAAEEHLKKLNQEFTEYKESYKQHIRKVSTGRVLNVFHLNKQDYTDVTVANITDDMLTLTHSGGILKAPREELPASMAASLAMTQTTPVQSSVPAVLRAVEEHRKAVANNALGAVSSNDGTAAVLSHYHVSGPEAVILQSVATVSIAVSEGTVFGSGFLVSQGDKIYFYTNAHVMAGGPNAKAVLTGGQEIKLPTSMEISDETEADDLVRMEVTPPDDVPLLEMPSSDNELAVDKPILALGNSGGAGVIPVLKGKIKAFGPFALEVDAEVIKGNSGGPVVLTGTKIVVGVVTHYQGPNTHDMGIGNTQFNALRRICLRPDRVMKWKPFTVARLVQEDKLIENCATDNYIFSFLHRAVFTRDGVGGLSPIELKRMGTSSVGPAISVLVKNTWAEIENAGKNTPAKRQVVLERFHLEVQKLYGTDVTGVDTGSLSHFHANVFKAVAKERTEITADLESHFELMMMQFRR